MRTELQVCSLDLAKRLKELGVKQESIFYWERDREMRFSVVSKENLELDLKRNNYQLPGDLYCSAFTVAELGEMLPATIQSEFDGRIYQAHVVKLLNGQYAATYENVQGEMVRRASPNEADARAKMLIYLLENNLCKNS